MKRMQEDQKKRELELKKREEDMERKRLENLKKRDEEQKKLEEDMNKKREEEKKKREEELQKKEEELQKEEEDEANQDSALEEIRAINGEIHEMRTNLGGGVERLLSNLRRQRLIMREFQKAEQEMKKLLEDTKPENFRDSMFV